MSATFEGAIDGRGVRLAIVVSRFNQLITDRLLEGAQEAISRHNVELVDTAHVPGAFELPLAAQKLAATGRYDAIVCLGAVLRGETPHFEYVAGQAASGIGRVGLDARLPVLFGVLTTDTLEQALERSGGKSGNKGYDAVMTALEMIDLLRKIDAS